MKYLKLYESNFVGYTPIEKKLIKSEIEDLIIDILELDEIMEYNIFFLSNMLSGVIRLNFIFNKSASINHILLSNFYRLTQLMSNRYSFKFDIVLYNGKGGVYNPLLDMDRQYLLDTLIVIKLIILIFI